MGIKLPNDHSGKSEKLRMEEIKSETTKYQSNAKFFTEVLNLLKEGAKTIQSYHDLKKTEKEWDGKNEVEVTKLKNSLVELDQIRESGKVKIKKLDLQEDYWIEIKKLISYEIDLIKGMDVGDERSKIKQELQETLKLIKFDPGK